MQTSQQSDTHLGFDLYLAISRDQFRRDFVALRSKWAWRGGVGGGGAGQGSGDEVSSKLN